MSKNLEKGRVGSRRAPSVGSVGSGEIDLNDVRARLLGHLGIPDQERLESGQSQDAVVGSIGLDSAMSGGVSRTESPAPAVETVAAVNPWETCEEFFSLRGWDMTGSRRISRHGEILTSLSGISRGRLSDIPVSIFLNKMMDSRRIEVAVLDSTELKLADIENKTETPKLVNLAVSVFDDGRVVIFNDRTHEESELTSDQQALWDVVLGIIRQNIEETKAVGEPTQGTDGRLSDGVGTAKTGVELGAPAVESEGARTPRQILEEFLGSKDREAYKGIVSAPFKLRDASGDPIEGPPVLGDIHVNSWFLEDGKLITILTIRVDSTSNGPADLLLQTEIIENGEVNFIDPLKGEIVEDPSEIQRERWEETLRIITEELERERAEEGEPTQGTDGRLSDGVGTAKTGVELGAPAVESDGVKTSRQTLEEFLAGGEDETYRDILSASFQKRDGSGKIIKGLPTLVDIGVRDWGDNTFELTVITERDKLLHIEISEDDTVVFFEPWTGDLEEEPPQIQVERLQETLRIITEELERERAEEGEPSQGTDGRLSDGAGAATTDTEPPASAVESAAAVTPRQTCEDFLRLSGFGIGTGSDREVHGQIVPANLKGDGIFVDQMSPRNLSVITVYVYGNSDDYLKLLLKTRIPKDGGIAFFDPETRRIVDEPSSYQTDLWEEVLRIIDLRVEEAKAEQARS